MFDRLRDRSSPLVVWSVRIILTLIALTFAVWGVESYFTSSAVTDAVATVDRNKITQMEFAESLRSQQEAMRERNRGLDASVFRTTEFKQSVLNMMIDRELLVRDAQQAGVLVSDAQLAERIQTVFQVDGKFSRELYAQQARNRGLSEAGYDQLLRGEFALQNYFDGIAGAAIIPQIAVERFIQITGQQREVSVANIKPEQFLTGVKVDAAQAKKYYDANLDEFKVPEQVKLEYVVYSAEKLAQEVEVAAQEIEAAYKEREREFVQKEERQASHILIAADANAPEAEKTAARKKAEDLLAQVKANPAKFAELAKQHSQDPVSAAEGGKLDFVTKDGLLTAAFEEAVFKMQKGEIAGPVATEFGYHVIKLEEINPQRGKTLAEVSEQLKTQLQKRKAGRQFAEKAEEFGDLVYDPTKGIKDAAQALKLEVKQSDWISKGFGGADALLNHPKLLEAVFSTAVLQEKRTTEPVEVAPNVLVAARVLESKPAATKTFDSVSAEITEKLRREEASKLAVKKGEELLAQLKAGKPASELTWSKETLVSRENFGDVNPMLQNTVFSADALKPPAFAGQADPGGGYALVRISKVVNVDKIDAQRRTSAKARLQDVYRNAAESATVASLKSRAKININQAALVEKTE